MKSSPLSSFANIGEVWTRISPNEVQLVCEGPLKRFLSIFNTRIFDSRVDRGMPSLSAAPSGPYTRPPQSRRASSIVDFSSEGGVRNRSRWTCGRVVEGLRESQLSSTENTSISLTMTDLSITFCNSRILPGQG